MSENINQNIKLTYELQIIKDGKVINSIKGNSKSFLRNYAELVRVFTTYTPSYAYLYDEDNTLVRYSGFGLSYYNNKGLRIEIGNGTAPVIPTDYRLSSFLDRKPANYSDLLVESDKCSFEAYSDFTFTTNQTISELGLALGENTGKFILIVRDLLSTPVSLPAGATLRVKYTFVFPV